MNFRYFQSIPDFALQLPLMYRGTNYLITGWAGMRKCVWVICLILDNRAMLQKCWVGRWGFLSEQAYVVGRSECAKKLCCYYDAGSTELLVAIKNPIESTHAVNQSSSQRRKSAYAFAPGQSFKEIKERYTVLHFAGFNGRLKGLIQLSSWELHFLIKQTVQISNFANQKVKVML